MSLNSLDFLLFFVIFLILMLVLQLLRKKNKYKLYVKKMQIILLLLFSSFFLGYSNWRFCLFALLYSIFIYILGIRISKKHKKIYLFAGIFLSICMLGYFKYINFFLSYFSLILENSQIIMDIILPVGISFYTFSGIAYLMDIYRGKYNAENNIIYFMLYMIFFAKIYAGPIVRANDFLKQIKNYRGIKIEAFNAGVQIFVFGMFKKVVLADHLGIFVDDVFYAPIAYNTCTVIWAVISYSLQIYFDFSGYSDMAIGIAQILGFDFKSNFNLPYIANGMSDFWKRWHISLSSWFQDYLYIPLGGSRKGKIRTYINLIAVMIVSGLWHGVGLKYVIWGGLHGIGNCITKVITDSGIAKGRVLDTVRVIVTYITVTLLWIIFRASNLSNAWEIFKGMFTIHTGISQPYTWTFFSLCCLSISTIAAMIKTKSNNEIYVNGYYPVLNLTKVIPLAIFLTFCGLTVLLGYFGNTVFIYGQY